MTQKSFEELVVRLDAYARRQPAAYRAEVAILAFLGYAYFAVVVAFISLVFGLLAMATLGRAYALMLVGAIIVLAIAWTVLLWSRIDPVLPEGYTVLPEEAPELFAMIDGLAHELKAPAVDSVLITGDFNAEMEQVPRYGLLGGELNYLSIGLPLMHALTPDQFRAVIAHEIAHLSGNHGKFSSWVCRIRQTWITALENVYDPARGGGFVLGTFLRWYAPFFSAYSFVLARSHEYEADSSAAKIVGPRVMAEMLVATRIKGRYLDGEYWPGVFRRATNSELPPSSPYTDLFQAVANLPCGEDAQRFFDEALAEHTTFSDTHPSLTSRLSKLGYHFTAGADAEPEPDRPLPLPTQVTRSAAEQYFSRKAGFFVKHIDADWHESVAPIWQTQFEEAEDNRRRMEKLKSIAKRDGLTLEEMWTLYELMIELQGDESAEPLLEQMLKLEPQDARACYALGMILLKKDDPRGVALLDLAMEHAPDSTIRASDAIYYFCKRNGMHSKAVEYRRRSEDYRAEQIRALAERQTVSARDTFIHHGLDHNKVLMLRTQIAHYPAFGEAFLVRKQCRHLPHKPLYIVGVAPRRSLFTPNRIVEQQDMREELAAALNLPGEFRLVLLVGRHRALRRALREMSSALIYRS